MILAAGRGERMGSLTATTPKPLLRVGGEALIVRQLRHLRSAGVREVVINLSYLGEQIRDALGAGSRWGVAIAYSQEPAEPLETAGGIVQALPLLGDRPFLLINADVVTDFGLERLDRQPQQGLGTLVLVPNPGHNPGGDFGLDAAGRLTQQAPLLTYAGIACFSPALFAGLEPGRRALKPVLDRGIEARELFGIRHQGQWLDVGTPARLAVAENALSAG